MMVSHHHNHNHNHHHHHHHNHQNHVIPKEATSFNNNGDYHFLPNSSPNWDANNGTSSTNRSTFCAIASMNLSAGMSCVSICVFFFLKNKLLIY
jgi:hypothetical protein